MDFLLPYARIELLIRTMLTRTWAPEAWPLVKHELAKSAQAAPPHCAGRLVELDARGRLLRAALGFLALEPHEPELRLLHRCFDTGGASATS